MKIATIISFIGIITMSFVLNTSPSEDIVKAFKASNTSEISSYFDNLIDFTLPAKDEIKNVSKNQAAVILKSFYSDNKITGFELTSQREAGTTMYIAGKITSKVKNYNITILLKNKEGKYVITSIRING